MEDILQLVGSAGYPSGIAGILLFFFFFLRKQEAAIRTEQLETFERLKEDITDYEAREKGHLEIINDLREKESNSVQEQARLKAQLIENGIEPGGKE